MIDAMLDRLGIGGLGRRHIRDLSGGQQQRVFLARALIGEPEVLILDEPTASVDIKTRDDILHLLVDLNRAGTTIVMTTHELNSLAAHLPWVVCVNQRDRRPGCPTQVFTDAILSRTFNAEMRVVRDQRPATCWWPRRGHTARSRIWRRHELVHRAIAYEFFRHGLLVAMLVGGLCGLIGTMIVLRRMSYIGHGLSHCGLRRRSCRLPDQRQLLPRRRVLGLPLGAADQRDRAAAEHRRRRGDRHRHDGLVRARRGADQPDALVSRATSRPRCSATSSA